MRGLAVRHAVADLPAVVEVLRLPGRQDPRVGALLDELPQRLLVRARDAVAQHDLTAIRECITATVEKSGVYPEPGETYEATLKRSPFSTVEMVPFDQAVERSIEQLIGLQLSNSYSTPARTPP